MARWRRVGVAVACTIGALAVPRSAVADGNPDPAFNLGQTLVADFSAVAPPGAQVFVREVVRDRLGRWLIVGQASQAAATGIGFTATGVMTRLLPDGRVDPSFGTRGYVTDPSNGGDWFPRSVSILLDGRLAVLASGGIVVLTADGRLDGSIGPGKAQSGSGSSALHDFSSTGGRLTTLPDGRVVLAGSEILVPPNQVLFAAAARIMQPDPTPQIPTVELHAPDGAPTQDAFELLNVRVAVDATGRFVVGGCTSNQARFAPACTLTAYTPDGAVDRSFGTGGLVRLTVAGADPIECGFDVAPDGSIVTACSAVSGIVRVAALDPSGRPDPTFAPTTFAATAPSQTDPIGFVQIEGSGRVLVGLNDVANPTGTNAVVHAFLPDGSVDQSFGTDGATRVRANSTMSGLTLDELGGAFAWGSDADSLHYWIASIDAPDGPALQPPAAGTARFVPLVPERVLDTRTGIGTTAQRPGPGATVRLPLTGRGLLPGSGVTAVALNVTATGALGPGYVTVSPSGRARPTVSNLNLGTANETNANFVVVPLGPDGAIDLFTQAGTNLVADLAGYFVEADAATSGRFQTAGAPFRILDTRIGAGAPAVKPAAGTQLDLQVSGAGAVPPSGASAVVLNLTGTEASADGFVTAWPSGTPRPTASSLNLEHQGTRANLVIVPIGSDGRVSLYTQSGTHLVADVEGWFTDSTAPLDSTGLFVAIPPRRMLDTRITPGSVPADGVIARAIGGTRVVPPGAASAVIANITATNARGAGFVTAMPTGSPRPVASTSNLPAAGATVPNAAVVGLAGDDVSLYSQSGADLIVDVDGWFLA